MVTYTGNGGYVYGELPDGSYKIISSPRSAGGQIISKDNPVWGYIHAELKNISPTDTSHEKAAASSSPYSRGNARNMTLEDARKSAASSAASKDTSPMAMAMEKSKSSPGATTSGSNFFKKPSPEDFAEMEKQVYASTHQKPMTLAEKATIIPREDQPDTVASGLRDRPTTTVVEMAKNLPDYSPSKKESKPMTGLASAGHLAEFLLGSVK